MRPWRFSGIAMLATIWLSGCAVTPVSLPMPAASAAPVAAGLGMVTIDTSSLRTLLGKNPKPPQLPDYDGVITRIRFSCALLDKPEFAPDPVLVDVVVGENEPTTTLALPAGLNRIVTVEGLNQSEEVVKISRAMVNVSAGSSVNVSLNSVKDAVARVFEAAKDIDSEAVEVLFQDATAATHLYASLTTQLAYDEGTNEYGGGVAPLHFRSQQLAMQLVESGDFSAIAIDQIVQNYPTYNAAALGHLLVKVTNNKALVYTGKVTILLPEPVTVSYDWLQGGFAFGALPPGTWSVRWTDGFDEHGQSFTMPEDNPETMVLSVDIQVGG